MKGGGGGEVLCSFSIYVLGDSMVTLLGAYDAFFKKTIVSYCASLHLGVQLGTSKFSDDTLRVISDLPTSTNSYC